MEIDPAIILTNKLNIKSLENRNVALMKSI